MYSNELIPAFLKRVAKRLDQEAGPGAFWRNSELLEYANEGMREVWQSARETHQNWFVRQMKSTDGVLTIGGRDYDTSVLKIVQGRDRLNLPPDFNQLLLFEAIPNPANAEPGGPAVPAVVLEYANMTQRLFRQGVFDRITTGVRRYRYDIVYGPEGPYIFVSPTLSFEDELDTQLAYVAMPAPLTAVGTFEGTGFTTLMVDAILAYTCYTAVQKQDLTEQLAVFKQLWDTKHELVRRAAGPKQTRDEETVDGYLEEELLYGGNT